MHCNSSKKTPTPETPRFRTQQTDAPAPSGAEQLSQAWVTASGKDNTWILRFEDGRLATARRAAACLLQPEKGDCVLVFAPASGQAWVLSVLEKAGDNSCLQLQGDVELDVRGGRLSVQAQDMDLKARQDLDLQAETLRLGGVRAMASFVDAGLQSLRLELRAKEAWAVFDSLSTRARSLVQHLRDSLRRVDNTETLEAGDLRERIENNRHTLAGSVTCKAKERMKLDGKKIHLG